jgi:YHS domain-containing protein
MMFAKQLITAALLGLALSGGFVSAVGAFDAASTAPVNVDAAQVIVHGHDVVAYFTEGAPVKGSAEFSASHAGATYWFASAANREQFRAAPEKYAPQYGGFCAMGAAVGGKYDVDPTQFRIVGGRLYLNKDAEVAKLWNRDLAGNIDKADKTWPRIKDTAPAAL